MSGQPLRVLRIYHSAVVAGFRTRDHLLQSFGVEETLLAPRRWNEGGREVDLLPALDEQPWIAEARTWGTHPYRFVYDPLILTRHIEPSLDLIDVHEEPASMSAGQVLVIRMLRRVRAPVVFYSAQNLMKRYPPPFRWIERWALRTAHTIYCCNSAAVDVLRQKGFGGRLVVLGLGVDLERFTPRTSQAPAIPLRLGYVGRLEHHKGVHVLLKAMVSVRTQTTLRIVGAGAALPDLRQQVERLHLRDRVTFTNFVDHDDLPSVYRDLDAVVVPSIPTPSWREQFCRVAIEAMASGVPVIASDDGALSEVIGNGGVLTPSGDADALAAAIDQLGGNPAVWRERSIAALRRAQEYSWTSIAEQHHRMYVEATS